MTQAPTTLNAPARSDRATARPDRPEQAAGRSARVHDDPRSAGIDGVRGIAALTVFMFHVWLYGRLFTPQAEPLNRSALVAYQFRLGLICFFVLTGFLLYRSFTRAAKRQKGPVDWKLYVKRRAARILPAYYACMALSYVMLQGAEDAPGVKLPETGQLWRYPLFLQNFSSESILRINPVTWTLVIEVGFYLLLPVIGLFAYYVARGHRGPQVLFALAMVGFGTWWHAYVFNENLSQLWSKTLPHYLPYFGVGMIAALWLEHRSDAQQRSFSGVQTIGLVGVALALVVGSGYWHAVSPSPRASAFVAVVHDLPAGVGFGLLIVAAAAGLGGAVAWIRAWPLASLGIVSYGFYLWHVPLILFVHSLGLEVTRFVPLFLIMFPITLAFASASWFWIEKPLIARAHRKPLVVDEQAAAAP